MSLRACLPIAIVLATAYMFMDGAYHNWRAAQLNHELNKRGFSGCENGQFNIRNFDIGEHGWDAIKIPDANPCQQ